MVVFNAANSITHEIVRYYAQTFSKNIFNKVISNAKRNRLFSYVANATCKADSSHAHFVEGRQLISKTNKLNQTISCRSYHYINDSLQYFPVSKVNIFKKDFQPHLLFLNVRQHSHYPSFLSKRHYSNDRQHDKPLPRLMDFPQIAWPSIFKVIKNWILTNFIITPYFDREFNLQDFLNGSKQAVEFVSQCLAKGDYDKLEQVVSAEALREIKTNISRFSIQQREDLAVCKDDIFFSFPYQVGVMFNENQQDGQVQQRFVEITVCYHVLKGLQELQAQAGKMPLNAGASAEFQDKVFILNYRFIREFTKGKSAEWTVNVVNHYRPSDYV